MVETVIAILPLLLIILKALIGERYTEEGRERRAKYERGKALSEGKSKTIGLHLSDLYRRVRQNRRTP